MFKRARPYLIVAAGLALLAVLPACPTEVKKPASHATESKAQLEQRMARLDVTYEILLKDDPPQNETLPFRIKTADAHKAIESGDLAQASALIGEAEAWLGQARVKYYQAHQDRIRDGSAKDTADSLMKEADLFLQRAAEKESQNDKWAADQYYQAAIEQGELALLTAKRSPATALDLITLSGKMDSIYKAAGKPDQASQSRQEVVKSLQASIDELSRMIYDRIEGRTPGFDQKSLSVGGDKFEKAKKELGGLNAKRDDIIEAAGQFAPGAIKAESLDPNVHNWINGMNKAIADARRKTGPNSHEVKNDPTQVIKFELIAHNKEYKDVAQPIKGSSILLKEDEIVNDGAALVIRGQLQNNRTTPIYRPRITVVGNVYSEVIDLGYKRFDPQMSTPFQIAIIGFDADALQAKGKMPPHELVIIFDEDNGVTRKLITKTFQ